MTLWSTAAAKHAVTAAITFYDFKKMFERLSLIGETIKLVNSKFAHGFSSGNSYGNLTGSCDIFYLHFLPDLRQI